MNATLGGVLRSLLVSAPVYIPAGWCGWLYYAARTGDAQLDRAAIRGRAVVQCALHGLLLPKYPRAVLAIVAEESEGNPDNYLGDGEKSAGPMQVNIRTARALGLFSGTDAEYVELAKDEAWGMAAGVAVLAAKLRDDPRLDNVKEGHLSGGDLAEAIRLYNGPSSPRPPELGYTQNVLDFAAARGWRIA